MRLALVLVALSVAGCVAPPTPDAPAAAAPASFAQADCVQVHSYFPSPAEPFRAFVPEGFTLVTDDPLGATVSVRVEATSCPESAEVWVELPVEPPADLARVEGATDFVPVVAYAQGAILHRYHAWGVALVAESDIALAAARGGEYALDVETPSEPYQFRGALDQGSGPFQPETTVRWFVEEGALTGRLVRAQGESTNVGFGPAALAYRGEGGSPPAASGIAHVVTAMPLDTSWEALA